MFRQVMASRKRVRTEDIPSSSNPSALTDAMEPDAQQAHSLIPMLQSLFRGQLMIFLEKVAWPEAQLPLERAHKVVPPRPIPAKTEPTSVEPQPPVVDPPASLELETLSPPAPPLIIIPDDSVDEATAPPDSPSCNIDNGSDFSDWMDC
ncbi:hypothetical protein GmHk_U059433 [Glycine max]|nr:hypothetical protein GmHk_U059433 [Glycine max]